MKHPVSERSVVLLDSCVLINLMLAGRTDLLQNLGRFDFRITTEVKEEIRREDQHDELEYLLAHGHLIVEPITDIDVVLDIERLKTRLCSGEASCIALARKTGWHVATDDKRACEITRTALGEGRLMTTPGLVLTAIRAGLLTVEEADSIRTRLMESRFRMSFGSFREVLEG